MLEASLYPPKKPKKDLARVEVMKKHAMRRLELFQNNLWVRLENKVLENEKSNY